LSIEHNFKVEVDLINRDDWSAHLGLFDDATIIQSWNFAEVVCREQHGQVSRMVLYRDGIPVALAQVRIVVLPWVSRGIAHVAWGPLWQRVGESADLEIFKTILMALHEEYALRRRLLLRIKPYITTNEGNEAIAALMGSGFISARRFPEERTIMLNILRPLPEIRKGLRKRWRQTLNKAEQKPLEIKSGWANEYYDEFLQIYTDMIEWKDFAPDIDTKRWRKLLENLPDAEKPRIFLVCYEGEPVAGLIISDLGGTGFPILAATNRTARKLNCAYSMFWQAIVWLKESGCSRFDLGGIDPENTPGTYIFKKGFRGEEVSFIGVFESCCSSVSSLIVRMGELIQSIVMSFRNRRSGQRPQKKQDNHL